MKNKKKKVSISGNCRFGWYCVLLVVIFAASVVLSIADKAHCIICWPVGYENIVGVSSQIITAVVSLVVSIVGIAISLQNEDFFGVKLTKLYALRISKHYSILSTITISIFLCTLNLIFYMVGLTAAAIGTMVVSLLFLLQVVHAEVPIMSKTEDALLHILKDNLISCYLNKVEASKDLKDAVKYLLYRRNIKEVYEIFKDDFDQEYNKYALIKLLEFQHDLAFDMKDKHGESEQRIIGSSLLENVFDIMLRHVKVSDEIYSEVASNKHLLTRVLFRLHELPSVQDRFFHKMSGLYQYLSFIPDDHKQENDLISDIIIIMVAGTVKEGDFSIIKAIRHQLSNSAYCLTQDSSALNVFAVLSMFLYYLSCSDPDVPVKIKSEIKVFVSEKNIIEDRTKIASWTDLFSKAANDFKVDYSRFISLTMRNSDTLEYYLFGNGAKCVILQCSYLSQWYLTHLLNTNGIYLFDFSALIKKHQDIKGYLKDFGEKCLDENKTFVPTTEMERIVEFYSNKTEQFHFFKICEEQNHKFFELVNGIKYEELKSGSEQAAKVDKTAFADKIRNSIEVAIKDEWGFDPEMEICSDTERCFSVFFEKEPEAINFEESIIDYCVHSIWEDLRRATSKTVLYNNDQFESGIREILSKNPQYVTASTKKIIPHFYIEDEALRQEFINTCEPLTEFNSKIIGETAIVLNDGFRFNCKVEVVEFRELTEEELSNEVAQHQRADGQFVFNGVFLPREEIIEIIKAKYTILTIIIKRQVLSLAKMVFELKPYSSGPED